MLEITIPRSEYYDEEENLFFEVKEQTLRLEHSLVSLSKWESKWKKPFLAKGIGSSEKTPEEILDYIRCMTLTQNVSPLVYRSLTNDNLIAITKYIDDPMTATTFSSMNNRPSRETITAEIIYYWMIALNIPFECQKWHLNRLLTLIKVCNIKNDPNSGKMSKSEILNRNRQLNQQRRQRLNTKG